jgi:DNA-binding transcriptional LysR family regulator
MDLKQIAYFMWVYEERSFSKAARRAQVVQPTLSMQVRRLEEEFGVQLFQRRSRGVEPTTAGHKLYERCVPIARNLELAQQEMAEAHRPNSVSGPIRVGLPSSFNRGLLTDLILSFMQRHPEVDVAISEAYTGTLIDWVQSGLVDFALGARPTGEGGLVQKLIYRDRVVLMSSVSLNGPSFSPCNLARINGLKLILPARNQSFGALAQKYLASGAIRVDKAIEINGTVGSFELARSSDWGLLTPFVSVFKDIGSPGVFIYPVEEPNIPFDLYLVYDSRRPLNGASRRFLDMTKAELKRADAVWNEMRKLPRQEANV